MHTSKLFHTVVVLGMALAAESACSSDTSPTTVADAGTTSSGQSGADSGTSGSSGSTAMDSGAVADAGSDAFAGWFCCG